MEGRARPFAALARSPVANRLAHTIKIWGSVSGKRLTKSYVICRLYIKLYMPLGGKDNVLTECGEVPEGGRSGENRR